MEKRIRGVDVLSALSPKDHGTIHLHLWYHGREFYMLKRGYALPLSYLYEKKKGRSQHHSADPIQNCYLQSRHHAARKEEIEEVA